MTNSDTYTRRRLLRTSGATLAAIGATGVVASTASAETDSPPQGILANGLGVESADRGAFVRGLMTSFSIGSTPSATLLADRMRNEFTANSEAWIDYGNWLIDTYDRVDPIGSVTLGLDVAVSRYWPGKDERVPTTIAAEFDETADELVSLTWTLEDPDDADYQATIRDTGAQRAADDLQEFRREFIDTEDGNHELPDEQYVSRLSGQYLPHMAFGEDSKHVLEILLGEVDA